MRNYLQMLSTLVWGLWPLTTFAASVTLGDTLSDIPLRAWLAVFVLSVVSGLMALLQRMNQAVALEEQLVRAPEDMKVAITSQLDTVGIPKGWRIFVTWHMLGALSMGALSFLFLESTPVNDFVESVIIALSAHSGARLFDRVSTGFSTKVLNALNRKASE